MRSAGDLLPAPAKIAWFARIDLRSQSVGAGPEPAQQRMEDRRRVRQNGKHRYYQRRGWDNEPY